MAFCQLGDLRWRVDPVNVNWSYQIDTARIETLGGQVVQILGATLSDMTISGDLGMDHYGRKESWQLANAFHRKIQAMMDAQVSLPFTKGPGTWVNAEQTYVHQPYQLTYHDGVHDWSFKVMIKGIEDGDGSGTSITYTNGKFNHRYNLTLFIVQAESDIVKTIASDAFISRIAKGVGWSKSNFHGSISAEAAAGFISNNGGSVTGFLAKVIGGEPLQVPGVP